MAEIGFMGRILEMGKLEGYFREENGCYFLTSEAKEKLFYFEEIAKRFLKDKKCVKDFKSFLFNPKTQKEEDEVDTIFWEKVIKNPKEDNKFVKFFFKNFGTVKNLIKILDISPTIIVLSFFFFIRESCDFLTNEDGKWILNEKV